MSDFISVDEHERMMEHRRQMAGREAKHTGVRCRKCEDREYAYADDMVCASYPPKRWVVCPNPKCGDRTTITV